MNNPVQIFQIDRERDQFGSRDQFRDHFFHYVTREFSRFEIFVNETSDKKITLLPLFFGYLVLKIQRHGGSCSLALTTAGTH